jgi:hypothetical protein
VIRAWSLQEGKYPNLELGPHGQNKFLKIRFYKFEIIIFS